MLRWSVGVWNETIAVGAPFKDEHETWNEGVARNSTGDENQMISWWGFKPIAKRTPKRNAVTSL